MGAVLVMNLVLISSLVLNCCGSMQMNHPRHQGNETDRLALLAFKAQILHDPNRVTSSWNESLHFCQWHGVTCSRLHHQRVTKLDLNSSALVGSISPHVGNLSFLRVLNLANNSFTHQIPPQIGYLHRLQVLYLNNNTLTGSIPPNISSCFQLNSLDLSRNNLLGQIPPQISSFSKLDFLSFRHNNLTGEIPPSLGNMSSLQKFGITSNNIEGSIPISLCQLKKLTIFYLGGNKLSGTIPSCIYNLSGIVAFELTLNRIKGSLPSNLGNAFPNLRWFSNAANQFTGPIPLSISNATNLMVFQCSDNNHSGQVPNLRNLYNLVGFKVSRNNLGSRKDDDLNFISDLINATQLTVLGIGGNNFGGTFPTTTYNLSTNLKWLSVGTNYLHGSIPTGLGNLVNLQVLILNENNFSSNIPTDIGKLSMLGELYLTSNNFSGSIPSSLGNLTMLGGLYLNRNNLKGSIPSSLGECHGLLDLDLSENSLDGKIPQQLLTGLHSLSISFNLSSNNFTGSIPFEIGKLKSLSKLDISNNMLSGELPSSLSSCQSLEVLHLQGNFFNGIIPKSMQDLRGIRDLDLSRNNFSGVIPQFLEKLNLARMNLSFNQLSGAVPIGGVFRNTTAASLAGNARLCGGMASLKLPLCKLNESKGVKLSRRIILTISLVFGCTLLGLVLVLSLFHLRNKRKEVKSSTLGNSILQVSYATLLKATDSFSPANLIGVGAFGSVYKGILADDRIVLAVKVLNMLHRGASKSFMAECEVLRNIRHRNLVKIITTCSSIDFNGNDFKALVYEFMDNGSLEEWLHPSIGTRELIEAPKSLSLVQRLDIAIDVASALNYLHNHCETPIVHCDLKPSNVLLDSNLIGHVSDFGLSKFLPVPTTSVGGNQSSSIGIRGSVGYAAPEYGMGSEVSAKGDVYSFGILLLEMFTGKRPTDHIFRDGLNLHVYVKTTLSERVSEISESLFLQERATNVTESHMHSRLSVRAQKVEECLTLILGVGVACSFESPTNRKDISGIESELQSIRRNLLG
ncbi:putative receptor-like protein kinase At3g47110 [Argentina anserina]|uniref:putative receptor-like protein kinase At3g47110 n=1 Tax=Argentina anserina TaxID=57926 RepID=UPI0021767B4E|nr:putative receptor-like protein kinase At3g47110 [Potentilla anserina]